MQSVEEKELLINRTHQSLSTEGRITVRDNRRFQSMSVAEVKALPPIEWLISDILPMGGLSIIYGDYGIGKSFLLLDWALCIATGRQWNTSPCKRGLVYYIAGEGVGSMGNRIKAWEHQNKIIVNQRLHVLGESMDLVKNKKELCDDIDALPEHPLLIIIDTWARCMLEGDENSGLDVGKFVAAADELRERYKAHMAIVHHKPKSGNRARGHTALPGAADTVIEVVAKNNLVTLKCEKQKDGHQFDPILLTLRQVEFDETNKSGEKQTSCVVSPSSAMPATTNLSASPNKKKIALDALISLEGGATNSKWHEKSGYGGPKSQDSLWSKIR